MEIRTPHVGETRRRDRHRKVPLLPEVRHFRAEGLEVRSNSKTDEITISGSPIVYNTPYAVRDMFGEFQETMAPGVATDAIANGADVRFLLNHDGLPLARSTSGTMSLRDSANGLTFTAVLDARQQLANDLAIAIERGDVSQMSCGFVVARDQWDEDMENRTIFSFDDLLDVSAVTYPASPTTSISIAQRMAMEIPVESRARARKIYAEVRAGKVLSAGNQDRLVAAATALSAVLDSAGFNPEPEAEEAPVEATEAPESAAGDATEAAAPVEAEATDEAPEAEPVTDPGDAVLAAARSKSSRAFRLQLEAHQRRRAA